MGGGQCRPEAVLDALRWCVRFGGVYARGVIGRYRP